MSRRTFIKATGSVAAGLMIRPLAVNDTSMKQDQPLFRISLAEWSVNKSIFAGRMVHLDFPAFAGGLGIDAVEYVNQFFMDRAGDRSYLSEMKSRAADLGVRSVLIMVDGEGAIGHPDERERQVAVEKHKKWVEAASFLGCHAIRVNGFVSNEWGAEPGDFDDEQKQVADGLRRLCEFADSYNIHVVIENHGGWSSHAKWLAGVMRLADHPRAGTLPDFGNFRIREGQTYDSYVGVSELMPFARGVSVKPTVYDAQGVRSDIDYQRMMRIVLDAGFRGFCGIEYGREGTEERDIRQVKRKLEETRARLAPDYP